MQFSVSAVPFKTLDLVGQSCFSEHAGLTQRALIARRNVQTDQRISFKATTGPLLYESSQRCAVSDISGIWLIYKCSSVLYVKCWCDAEFCYQCILKSPVQEQFFQFLLRTSKDAGYNVSVISEALRQSRAVQQDRFQFSHI